MTPRPICINCNHEAVIDGDGGEIWTINPEGYWICDDCEQASWNDEGRQNELTPAHGS